MLKPCQMGKMGGEKIEQIISKLGVYYVHI